MSNRYPTPVEMWPVDDFMVKEVRALLHLSAVTTEGASVPFQGDTADYFLLTQEAVALGNNPGPDTPATTLDRVQWAQNEFFYVGADGVETAVEVGKGGKLHGAEALRENAVAIAAGQLAGEHTVRAVKWMEPQFEGESSIVVSAQVTRRSDGLSVVETSADLHLVRTYDDGFGTIIQAHRLEDDKTAGELREGSELAAERLLPAGDGSFDAATGEENFVTVADPTPHETAVAAQGAFSPLIRADLFLTEAQWTQLLTQPLNPANRLQPYNRI
jgi:hypothetical protein